MERARHKGVILGDVGEYHQLGTTDGVAVGGESGGPLDGGAHEADGIHVDARLGGRHVHRGADQIGLGQSLGNDGDQVAIPLGHALMHQGGIAADEVDAHGIGRPLEGMSQFEEHVGGHIPRHQRDGGDGHPLVDDRDAVLLLNVLTRSHQLFGLAGDLIVNVVAQAVPVVADAIEERDAHGDGADIQILLPDHLDGFQYISRI